MFEFSNYSAKSKYWCYDNEEFIGVANKIYSFLPENIENKITNCVNRNIVATISHNECKDLLLNNKCLRHSMNRIKSKDDRTETNQINRI